MGYLKKSDTISLELKKEGNEFYEKRRFKDALLKYNAALCYSKDDSENLSHAFANRSAACFEMKKYEECLRNIKLAMKNNYPPANLHVLKLREEKCLDLIRKQKNNNSSKWDFFKLSYKSKMTNPQIADILELKCSEKFGRFIVTREDVKAGSILAIEKPFCSVLLSNSRHVTVDSLNKFYRCAFCLKKNIFELLPCPGCCCSMFCEECFDEAFESFHKYECEIMDELIQSGSVHIALRIFFIALSAFDGSIDKLQKFMKQIDEGDKNYSIFNFNSSKEECVKNYLRFLNSLSRSGKNFNIDEHLRILKNHQKINIILDTHVDFIKEFLLRQCQTNDHYFHGIFSSSLNDETSTNQSVQQAIGTGWFPFHSLINHSCASNVMRINVDGKLVLFAVRFIPKDSQIFDCYKVSFTKHLKSERQERLLKEFGFKCDCEACERDFKMPPPIKNIVAAKAAVRIEKEISSCNGKGLPKIFKEITQLMNENYMHFPSLELILLQKCFAHVLLLQAT